MSIIKEDMIFGRIAVLNNIISQEHLDEALAIQKTSDPPRLLSMILLEKGYISKLQLKTILETQKKRLPKPAVTIQERREDIAFAYLTVKHKYVDVETIFACLQQQSELVKKGLLFRLSELLINQGKLTVQAAEAVLALQDNRIVECPRCNTRYNTVGMQPHAEFACKKCDIVMRVPSQTDDENEAEAIEQFRQAIESIAEKNRLQGENKIVPPARDRKANALPETDTPGAAQSLLGDTAAVMSANAPQTAAASTEPSSNHQEDDAQPPDPSDEEATDYIDLESAEEIADEEPSTTDCADEDYMDLDAGDKPAHTTDEEDEYNPLPDTASVRHEEYLQVFGIGSAEDKSKKTNGEKYLALEKVAPKANADSAKD